MPNSEPEIVYTTLRHRLVGEVLLLANRTHLIGLYLTDSDKAPKIQRSWKRSRNHPVLVMAGLQLREYFRGERKKFTVPLAFEGTEFQRKIWNLMAEIPWGVAISYSDLARKAGMPAARRTVGTAVAKNPLDIFIPAHRVVAQDGGLGGFAGKWNARRGYWNSRDICSINEGTGS